MTIKRFLHKPASLFLIAALVCCRNTDAQKSETDDERKTPAAQTQSSSLEVERSTSQKPATGFALRDGVLVHEDSSKELHYRLLLDFAQKARLSDSSITSQTTKSRQYLELVLSLAERLEQLRAAGDTLPSFFDWEEGDSYFKIDAAVLLPYARARAYLAQGETTKWLEQMQRIMEAHAGRSLFLDQAGPGVAMETANTYLYDLRDTTRATEQYHFVISRFPHMDYYGNCSSSYEYAWKAEGAAWAIRRLYENNAVRLQRESARIISATPYFEIKLLGYGGIVRAMGLQNRFQQMIDTVMTVLTLHPNVQYPDSSESERQDLSECLPVNYSAQFLSAAIAVLAEKGEITLLAQLAESVIAKFEHYEIGAGAALQRAEHADWTNAGLAEALTLYRRAEELHVATSRFDHRSAQEAFAASKAGQRLRYLSSLSPAEAELVMPFTELRLGYGKQFPAVRRLPRGTRVKFLYNEPTPPNVIEYRFQWAKIELPEGMIGWVPQSHLHLTRE